MDFLFEIEDAADELTRKIRAASAKIAKVGKDLELARAMGREAKSLRLEGQLEALEERRDSLREELERAA